MSGDYILPIEEQVQLMSAPPQAIPYGLKMLAIELEWLEVSGGLGLKAGVIDTGAPKHKDLTVANAVDMTGEGTEDYRGHGTHVAGTICANGALKGGVPMAELYTAKVFKRTGGANREHLVAALDWMRAKKVDAINMSLGGPGHDPAVEAACRRCEEAGILIVASAGNFGNDYPVCYPAEYDSCLSTSALDAYKRHADFSSRGPNVELAAAGVQVYSTWLNNQYMLLDGTSMAAPHITAAALICKAKYRLRFGTDPTPRELRRFMAFYAEDLGERGRDRKFGYGLFSFGRVEGATPAPDRPANEIIFKVGDRAYWENGQRKEALTAPRIMEDGRAYQGVRDAGMIAGYQVDWIEPETIKWRR